ncbi:hypothetical protein B2M20_08285, partial [Nitrobacter vulgaris]
MHKDWEQRLKDSPVAADTLVWAEVADTWAVAAGVAGITWAWVEAGAAAVLAGPAAGGGGGGGGGVFLGGGGWGGGGGGGGGGAGQYFGFKKQRGWG